MKKTIKLAVVAAMALGTTSAFATNGDVMIGQGAKSRGMGGIGIAKSFGAESALANPAMITSVESFEITGAVTVFMPDVAFGSNAQSNAGAAFQPGANAPVVGINSADSASDMSIIPEIYFAQRINESFAYGVAVAGTAGMGVDYSDTDFGMPSDNGSFQMKTALQLLKVAVPLTYELAGVTFAVAPVVQYGTLQMSHQGQTGFAPMNPSANPGPTNPMVPTFALHESPTSADTGFGFEAGLAYNAKSIGLTVAGVYKSKIGMEYKDTIAKSVEKFGGAQATGVASGDNLDQPAEFGIGIAYDIVNSGHTIAFDYKNIAWGSAAGYEDFGWENQDVFAVGYEFAAKSWALRAGYNYASNPIAEQDGKTYSGAVKNFFNTAGFPGIVESHFTLGGGVAFTDLFSMDAAFIYAPETSVSYDTTAMTQAFAAQSAQANGMPGAPATGASSAEVKHSQMGVTIAATFKF